MRKQFLAAKDTLSRRNAKRLCPWAAIIVTVDGGWMAFESLADYHAWKDQK